MEILGRSDGEQRGPKTSPTFFRRATTASLHPIMSLSFIRARISFFGMSIDCALVKHAAYSASGGAGGAAGAAAAGGACWDGFVAPPALTFSMADFSTHKDGMVCPRRFFFVPHRLRFIFTL